MEHMDEGDGEYNWLQSLDAETGLGGLGQFSFQLDPAPDNPAAGQEQLNAPNLQNNSLFATDYDNFPNDPNFGIDPRLLLQQVQGQSQANPFQSQQNDLGSHPTQLGQQPGRNNGSRPTPGQGLQAQRQPQQPAPQSSYPAQPSLHLPQDSTPAQQQSLPLPQQQPLPLPQQQSLPLPQQQSLPLPQQQSLPLPQQQPLPLPLPQQQQQQLPLPQPNSLPQQPQQQQLQLGTPAQVVDQFLAFVGNNPAVLQELARRLAIIQQQSGQSLLPSAPLQATGSAVGANLESSQPVPASNPAFQETSGSGPRLMPLGVELQLAHDRQPYHTLPPQNRRDPADDSRREISQSKKMAYWSDTPERREWSRRYDAFYGRIRAGTLPQWGPNSKFEYDELGEMVQGRTFSRDDIWHFVTHHPRRLSLMLQLAPAKLTVRVSESGNTCRWDCCPSNTRTIHNTHMISLQEFQPEIEAGVHNPYRTAGVVHLWCFEQMFDIVPMIESGLLRPEFHRLAAETENNLSIERDRKGAVENGYNSWIRNNAHRQFPRLYPDSLLYSLTRHFHENRPDSHKRQAENRDTKRGRATVSGVHVNWNDLRIQCNNKTQGVTEAFRQWYANTYHTPYNPHMPIQELIDAGHPQDENLEVAIKAAEATGVGRPVYRPPPANSGRPAVPSVRPKTPGKKRTREGEEQDETATKPSKRTKTATEDGASSVVQTVSPAPPILVPAATMTAAPAAPVDQAAVSTSTVTAATAPTTAVAATPAPTTTVTAAPAPTAPMTAGPVLSMPPPPAQEHTENTNAGTTVQGQPSAADSANANGGQFSRSDFDSVQLLVDYNNGEQPVAGGTDVPSQEAPAAVEPNPWNVPYPPDLDLEDFDFGDEALVEQPFTNDNNGEQPVAGDPDVPYPPELGLDVDSGNDVLLGPVATPDFDQDIMDLFGESPPPAEGDGAPQA